MMKLFKPNFKRKKMRRFEKCKSTPKLMASISPWMKKKKNQNIRGILLPKKSLTSSRKRTVRE